MNKPHTIWTFIKSSWRWIPFRVCDDYSKATTVLREMGTDQYSKDKDGLPVWFIKPSSSNFPPTLPRSLKKEMPL